MGNSGGRGYIKNKAHPKIKKGKPYEYAVGDVFKKIYGESAEIEVGKWVKGPDGRRELDVSVNLVTQENILKGVVECKDFSRKTGPVGIAYVDALDSKRRDLNFDFAFICSNAGFTIDAIRKAKRIGIGLISATARLDGRIKFSVIDFRYIRDITTACYQIEVIPETASPETLKKIHEATLNDSILFNGKSVIQWVNVKTHSVLALNPIVNCFIKNELKFSSPVEVHIEGEKFLIKQINAYMEVSGAWFKCKVAIDSTSGLYNWINKRVGMSFEKDDDLVFSPVEPYAGEFVMAPPDLGEYRYNTPGAEIETHIVTMPSYPVENAANLDAYLIPECVDLVIPDIEAKHKTSVEGYKQNSSFIYSNPLKLSW